MDVALAITGPRQLSPSQCQQVLRELERLPQSLTWHIGDATGVDELAWRIANRQGARIELYRKNPQLPWRAQGAERSTRMIRGLAASGGELHAWPNKPAPVDLKPSKSWPKGANGSGTWGTIALAVGLGVPVVLHPLVEMELPDWLVSAQITLI